MDAWQVIRSLFLFAICVFSFRAACSAAENDTRPNAKGFTLSKGLFAISGASCLLSFYVLSGSP
jgi:hypothetical protein